MQISGNLAKNFLLLLSKCKEYFCGCVCGDKRAAPSFENELVQLYVIIFVINCSQEADNGLFLISHCTFRDVWALDLHFFVYIVYP